MTSNRLFTKILMAMLWVLGTSSALAQAQPAVAKTITLDIASQPLSDALTELGKQTGLQVVLYSVIAKQSTVRLTGQFTTEAALDRLLADTGLRYEYLDARTIAILSASQPSPSGNVVGDAEPTVKLAQGEHNSSKMQQVEDQDQHSKMNDVDQGASKQSDPKVAEVVVVGTHIRGANNPTSPVQIYDREAIARAGRTTTPEFLKTITANFKGGDAGASEDGVLNGRSGLTNIEGASGVNLRGLGVGSTLVLLNGHRVASSAYGSAVDISMIPLEALERVEVLTDGASAIYGADAVGGVVNFVVRSDYNGAESSLRAGTTTQGGRDEYAATQTMGTNWGRGGVLATVQYQKSQALATSQRSFTETAPGPTDLYPSRDQYSAVVSAHQQLSDAVALSGDVLYTSEDQERSYDNGFEDHYQAVDVDFLSTSAALRWRVFSGWQLAATALYSRVESEVRSKYDPPHTDYINGEPELENRFTIAEGGLKADGSLFSITGGQIKVAAGAAHRRERFSSDVIGNPLAPSLAKKNVTSFFSEALIPLISSMNTLPLARSFEVSLSLRHDRYNEFGSTTNPKFGLSWKPVESVHLRASYGTSFRAPDASQVSTQGRNLAVYAINALVQPDGVDRPVLLQLASAALSPEKSRNLNIGIEYTPAFTPALTLSADYYRIRYDDRIVTPPYDAAALLRPDVYGPLIGQFANDEAVADFVADLVASGFTFYDFSDNQTGTVGIRNSFILGLVNASRVRQSGFDLAARYVVESGVNRFDMQANATLIENISTAFCASCVTTNILDVYGQPLRLRLRALVGWARNDVQMNLAANRVNGYSDTNVVPPGRIGPWTTFDLNFRYAPASLNGLSFAANVINLLDEDPPETAGSGAVSNLFYDSANADPLGRVLSLQVQKRW